MVLIGTNEAFSQPAFAFYYNNYGDRLTWDVPQPVLYRLHRSYYGYDIVHVRQVPFRGYVDFEVILERRGRFISVAIDEFGGLLRGAQVVNAHFNHHICDHHCGFHQSHFRTYYRPRPTVVVNKHYSYHKHGNGYGYGNGNGHGNKYNKHDNHQGGKYKNDHDDNKYRDSGRRDWDSDGDRSRNDSRSGNDNQGNDGDKYRGQSDRGRNDSNNKSESNGYRRSPQSTSSSGTRSAIVLNN